MLVIVSCMMVLVRLSLRIVIDILHIGRKCGEMLRLKMKQDLLTLLSYEPKADGVFEITGV